MQQLPPGEVFTAKDFGLGSQHQPALVKYLNRRVRQKELSRLSKGRYYKPRCTRFGNLRPRIDEIVKDFIVKDGKMVGYVSGAAAFAKLGLTTQISSEILIGSPIYRRPTTRGDYGVRFFQQRNPITESTVPLLQLLDALRHFREIPGTTPIEAISRLIDLLRLQSDDEREQILSLARAYPPYVRALLGAILEKIGYPNDELRQTLNGLSTYKLKIPSSVLPTITNWNII